ncbi:DNA polymerase III chi subunit, HolC [Sphingomonas sp. MM-1]|uniref:DNA polymerase III subunit chi n=1 Tax=Sphingomonas sp. MM-1 TaxID=745310 RepID=UPI0002C0F5FC|nr:DNA polymerase III subunit chi [Sphingomonas sp. MM-1]AGH48299.1 DNA polymerase III chi subunit, HolC [Sphingomonas sp. MM-1]
MQVDFYHLASSPIERVLPRIAERLLVDGARLLVVCADDGQAARLDQQLWTYAADSFLPHGRAGDGGEALQPVLIAATADAANGARNIALADGIWRDEALAFDRAFHLFDDGSIDAARAAWKALAGREDVVRNFWKQDESGRWAKAA